MAEPSRKRLRKVETPNISSLDNFDDCEEAACGIIHSVTLKNFMCHAHLHVEFSPKVNLVQGRNGSGKSAILSGVVVALGGSTRSTNRGSSLKDLIKYDKNTASVEVTLKNSGKDAYKREVFGDLIIIERKITASGGSTYIIKTSNGKVVSGKREELKRLCDFYNINVENPLTVLNQDMSRSFLSSADPRNLYKFYLQATQLQQICDSYFHLNENLNLSSNLIENHRSYLPMLQDEVKALERRYEFCLKHKEKRQKLKDLRRELVWAKIRKSEKDSEVTTKEYETILKTVEKIQENLAQITIEVEEAQKENKEVEGKFYSVSNDVKDKITDYTKQKEVRIQAKEMCKTKQREIEKRKRQVEVVDKEIIALKAAMKTNHVLVQQKWEENHKIQLEKIGMIETEIGEITQIMKTEETHLNNIKNTSKVMMDNKQQMQFEEKNHERNINELNQELRNLQQSQQTNTYTVYGQWVQPLLNKIEMADRNGKFSNRPIGPIGAYVEVLESRWAHVAEMVLGPRISAFIVNNNQDEKVLRSLFQEVRFNNNYPMIVNRAFRNRFDPNDIKRYEVKSDRYISLWSILKINNDNVANVILDRCSAETVLLIPTAEEAGELLKNSQTVPQNCTVAYTLNGDKYFPDPAYKVYSGSGQKHARYLQISVGERAQTVKNEIRLATNELEKIVEERKKIEGEINIHRRQEGECHQKLQKEKNKVRKLREQLLQVQTMEEAPPPNVLQLEDDILKQEAIKATALENLNAVQEQMSLLQEEYNNINSVFNEIQQNLSQLTATANQFQDEMKKTGDNLSRKNNSLDVCKQTLKKYDNKKNEMAVRKDKTIKLLEEESKMAENFLPRVETEREPKELEKLYKIYEDTFNKEQERHGDPVKITEDYHRAKTKLAKMENELQANNDLIKKLKESLAERRRRFTRFRKTLSIMIKTCFMDALAHRNMTGKIHFDDENEMLRLYVKKKGSASDMEIVNISSSQDKNKNKRDQMENMSMMSGGERSFATVSFVLTLWEVMDSPVRILDEFDVFMDIIARRQSLDMMIAAAKPKTQYIYLTPLEVNRSQYSKELNVFRMPDPERRNRDEASE